MAWPADAYDAAALDLMEEALTAACRRLEAEPATNAGLERMILALRIVAAIDDGERDIERLVEVAVEAM